MDEGARAEAHAVLVHVITDDDLRLEDDMRRNNEGVSAMTD